MPTVALIALDSLYKLNIFSETGTRATPRVKSGADKRIFGSFLTKIRTRSCVLPNQHTSSKLVKIS